MTKKQLSIFNCFVTLQCNISCPYCFVKKAKTKFNIDKVPDNINTSNYDYICILGGEPGLLEKDEVDSLMSKLDYFTRRKILVATNGTFLKKYQKDYPDINYCYHITNLENPIFYDNVTNHLILTSKNAEQVLEFSKKHKDRQFRINQNMKESLFKPNRIKILKEIMKLPNLTFNKIVDTRLDYDCSDKCNAFDYI